MTPGETAAIVFADIAGSTQLYEQMGDAPAQALITRSLDAARSLIARHGGEVIKTLGDELMCALPSANAATAAAVDIQKHFRPAGPPAQQTVRFRIGLHWGRVIHRQQDIFGDAVNVAARMTAIARAGQIVTTDATVARMSDAHRDITRRFDVTPVKGKRDEMSIHEVLWDQDDVTALLTSMPGMDATELPMALELECGGDKLRLNRSPIPFLIGRERDCDLTVDAPAASRHHARIEWRRGKFVLVDQSTNGTYVRIDDAGGRPGEDVFLRREEFPLMRSGAISLGSRAESAGVHVILFRCG